MGFEFTDNDGNELVGVQPDKYGEELKTSFRYSAKDINKLIDEFETNKVVMRGVYNDLLELKPIIEELYDKNIFYLSYWKSECGWFGWDWTNDDGRMKNMANITDGITQRIEEIYALILGGLGLRFIKNDNDEWITEKVGGDE